jgi:hypothetical protein
MNTFDAFFHDGSFQKISRTQYIAYRYTYHIVYGEYCQYLIARFAKKKYIAYKGQGNSAKTLADFYPGAINHRIMRGEMEDAYSKEKSRGSAKERESQDI